jgi:hypothetical protein
MAMGSHGWLGSAVAIRGAVLALVVSGAWLGIACSDDEEFVTPTDVAGLYDLTVRNVSNGCGFENWEDGATATNIGLRIEQDGSELTGQLQGLAGGIVALLIGTAEFTGTESRGDVTLQAYSGYVRQEGTCTYNLLVTLHGSLDGHVMSGTIDYTWATNDSPDCTGLEECVSQQSFDAIRTSTEPADGGLGGAGGAE